MNPRPPFLDFSPEDFVELSSSVDPRGVVVLEEDEWDVMELGLGLGLGAGLRSDSDRKAGGAAMTSFPGGTVISRSGPTS